MNIENITPTAAVILADKARMMELEGKKVIKLQTGDPDFNTHESIKEALNLALKKNQTHYSFSQGLPELRSILANKLSKLSDCTLREKQILITHGAVQAFESVLSALVNYDDEVIILEPNWPTIDSLVKMLGGRIKKVDFLDDTENLIEKLNLSYTDKVKVISFNFPNNPTGIILPQNQIDAICEWAIEKNLYILADEVYGFLQYTSKTVSTIGFLKKYDKYIYIDSFSKKFAMTGFRIGYVASSESTIKNIAKASQLTITNIAPFVQFAAIEALSNELSIEYSNWMRDQYRERRDTIINECKNLGLTFITPDGAFYIFIKLNSGLSDIAFCESLLENYNICVVPGSAFGESGSGYIRISYSCDIQIVLEALNIISKDLKNVK